MKCKEVKVNNIKKFQFQLKPIGLENIGATCYMNATLQVLSQIPELHDFFLYGPPRQEYDNRFINLINHWMGMNLGNEVLEKIDLNFDPNNKGHIQKLRKFCIERLGKIKPKKNQWDNNAIEELKLILKCFPDDEFYTVLLDEFGEKLQGVKTVTNLPLEAIDIGYEFFLVLKNIDELEKSNIGKNYYKPKRFKDFLSIVNPLFKGIAANDSKDLILFLYETWHNIYNKAKGKQTVTNALKLDKGIYANIDIAQDIRKQISNIKNSLGFLFIGELQHSQASNNIKKCKDAILSCIENAKLDTQAKEWLKKTITAIINNILAIQDINYIPTLTQQLQCFSNTAYSYIAQLPDNQEFENFLSNYFSENGSIVTDHFYHVETNTIKCHSCSLEKTSYTMKNIIIFPLMKVYQYKNKCLQNNGQMINMSGIGKKIVTIQDCFRQFPEPEVLNGQNQIYCNNCNRMSDGSNANKLKTLPQKMTLIFNRGKGLEFNVDIEHADYIDPFDILDFDPANYQCFHWINVRASILHLGESGMGGHFISAARSEKDNKPRTYNDAMVNDREKMEAGVQYNQKELSYVWFTDTMTLHLEIDTILEKVKNDQFRDAICAKFLSLGVLDAQEKNSINKNRQMIFAYLLMYAFEKCMANKNLIYDQSNQDKAQDFDKYLSDFICDAFNMIATWDDFNFDENNCLATTNQIKNWRQNILNCAQNANYVPKPGIPIKFNVYDDQFNNVINDQNIIINNNIRANINNQNIINKNINNKRTWLKFAFAAIFVVTTIVLIVLELYLYALIPFVLMFAPFIIPKLCKSCCRSSYPINSSHENEPDFYGNNQDNCTEVPYSDSPNIIENNQIKN